MGTEDSTDNIMPVTIDSNENAKWYQKIGQANKSKCMKGMTNASTENYIG